MCPYQIQPRFRVFICSTLEARPRATDYWHVSCCHACARDIPCQAHNKCYPDVTSSYVLRVRIIDTKESHRDKGAAVSKKQLD